ncbi:hypothetical protein HORIV_58150 [Vreelandella olivaria]|uniref:ClpA/ClpB AAA lid domain-containing protein n=1 Tax=Vreelandella olivaria TaxID=390919 RepID=A0ABN5X2B5_9GAMM|nr:hypothetical protein HORIV_58150 [Halomonas olivaria]
MILRGLRDVYERAHGVLIGDSGLRAAAALSARYLAGRQLPDKAIDVLDTACTRLAQALDTPPRKLSHLQSEHIAALRERDQVERERLLGREPDSELHQDLTERLAKLEEELASLEAAWQAQRECVDAIVTLHRQLLEATEGDAVDQLPEGVHQALAEREQQLAQLQETFALVNPSVEEAQIAQVIGDWTGVPVERMTSDELTRLTELPTHLDALIQGQSSAIERIHRHLLTARADLRRPGRPRFFW